MLDEAAAIVDSLPDGEVAEGLDLVAWIGMAELCEERPDAAIRHFDRALRVARATGQGHVVSYVHGLHGAAYAAVGNLTAAADCFDDALDAAMLTGSRRLRGAALEHQCYLAVWRGDLDEALRLGKEAFGCAPEGDVMGTSTASGALALAHLHAGDPATCVDLMEASAGGPELLNVNPALRADWYDILAAAEAARGRTERAAAWADQADAWAAGLSRRTGLARLARVHALLPVDPAGAVAHAREAVRLLTRSSDRVAAGRAHLYAGITLAAAGETDDARARFGEARAVFEACGARLFLEQAVREERRMNARSPRRTRRNAPVDSVAGAVDQPGTHLTARELQVARLAAEGMTNRQIGEALYLSPKTVGIHLSRVYAKLGVSRRAALAARLTRDLPDRPAPDRTLPD